MQCRMDSSAFDSLPPSLKAPLKQKSNAAWKPVNAATSEMNTVLKQVEAKLVECKAYRSQAESVGNQLRDPKEYVAEMHKLEEEIEKETAVTMIKGDRLIKANEAVADIQKQPPDVQANWYRNNLGQWQRYEPEIKAAVQKLKSLCARALVPRGATEDKRVADALASVKKAAQEAVDRCETALVAGGQLQAKIQLQSQRLQQQAKAQST
jgi:hypothetical protein